MHYCAVILMKTLLASPGFHTTAFDTAVSKYGPFDSYIFITTVEDSETARNTLNTLWRMYCSGEAVCRVIKANIMDASDAISRVMEAVCEMGSDELYVLVGAGLRALNLYIVFAGILLEAAGLVKNTKIIAFVEYRNEMFEVDESVHRLVYRVSTLMKDKQAMDFVLKLSLREDIFVTGQARLIEVTRALGEEPYKVRRLLKKLCSYDLIKQVSRGKYALTVGGEVAISLAKLLKICKKSIS